MRRYATGRKRPGQMNRLESAYAQLLEGLRIGNKIQWFAFEGIKLRLADKTFFTPDFFVMNDKGELECHETKGFWEDDARVKIKVAAEKFPFKFVAITYKRKTWEFEEI